MEKSIVCGVDGSADSAAALAVAARLADRLDAGLVLANVVEYVHSPDATLAAVGPVSLAATAGVPPEQVRAGERLVQEMAERANVETAQRRVVRGFAAERLADLADEEGAQLIVVGSRGRGAFKAAFLGSVSTSLIGVARCPVLVVPPGARDTARDRVHELRAAIASKWSLDGATYRAAPRWPRSGFAASMGAVIGTRRCRGQRMETDREFRPPSPGRGAPCRSAPRRRRLKEERS